LFDNEKALTESFHNLQKENSPWSAPVSINIPLISNQDVCMNIALIKQYHENVPWPRAKNIVLEVLSRLNLEHIAPLRNPALSSDERFCAMLLRAAMVKNAILMIDRPFLIIPHLKNIDFVYNTLHIIEDLYAFCYIFDYVWSKNKYGEL